MESFGGPGKKKERIGRMALYASMLAAVISNPGETPAGKRETLARSQGISAQKETKPIARAEQATEGDPPVQFRTPGYVPPGLEAPDQRLSAPGDEPDASVRG